MLRHTTHAAVPARSSRTSSTPPSSRAWTRGSFPAPWASRASTERHSPVIGPKAAPHRRKRRRYLGRRPVDPACAITGRTVDVLELRFTPVLLEDGQVGGVSVVATETTARALLRRRAGAARTLVNDALARLLAGRARPVLRRLAVAAGRLRRDVPRRLPALAPRPTRPRWRIAWASASTSGRRASPCCRPRWRGSRRCSTR